MGGRVVEGTGLEKRDALFFCTFSIPPYCFLYLKTKAIRKKRTESQGEFRWPFRWQVSVYHAVAVVCP
jgi:hypothetical protein